MIVLGIDPGPTRTGVVIADTTLGRTNEAVIDHHVYIRNTGERLHEYAASVARLIGADIIKHGPIDLAAVEAFNPPTPHLGGIDPAYAVETAFLVGWFHATHWPWPHIPSVLVAPAGHGKHPLAVYPPCLVGPRETTGTGKSPRQHARAAWDVAQAAPTHYRTEQAR